AAARAKAFYANGLEGYAGVLRAPGEGCDQRPVLHHMREWLARLDIAAEGEKHRPHRIAQAAVGDHHVADRLRLAGDFFPDPDGNKQPARGGDDGRGARIRTPPREQRIGDRDRKTLAKSLT